MVLQANKAFFRPEHAGIVPQAEDIEGERWVSLRLML